MTPPSPAPEPDFAAALAHLPHGPEFRFVDRLVELDPGRHGVAEYTLPVDAVFLRGHFPGDPLMPGVLLLEAGAQLAGVVGQSDPGQPVLPGLKLAAVRMAKFTGALRPGATARFQADVISRMGGLIQARVQAWVEGSPIMAAEVVLAGSPAQAAG